MFETCLEDFHNIKRLGVIAMSKELYLRCENDIKKIIIILSLISLKDEGKENITKEEITNRMNFINKYFNIRNPELIKDTIYFKPNISKVHKLLFKDTIEFIPI